MAVRSPCGAIKGTSQGGPGCSSVISRFFILSIYQVYQLGTSKTNFQSNLIRPCRSKTLRWKPPLNGKFNPRSSECTRTLTQVHNSNIAITITMTQVHNIAISQSHQVHNITIPFCFRFTVAITISQSHSDNLNRNFTNSQLFPAHIYTCETYR